jgi:1-phosphatidylinositol-4-phosphate 5-kinase
LGCVVLFSLTVFVTLPQHIISNPHSTLTHFFGLHRVKVNNEASIHFVVMGNIFATDKEIHLQYDLKVSGSQLSALMLR